MDSLHKYIPRVAVVRIGNKKNNEENIVIADYCFEKASFVAVTAYQNEEVIDYCCVSSLGVQTSPINAIT